jgi:hypothetical protein
MKIGGLRAASLALVGLCLLGGRAQAMDIYYNNIDADLPGTGITPNGVWAWTAGPDAVFTNEVTVDGGVNGSQSFRQTTDAAGAVGTSWFFVRGFGQFSVWADENSPLAGGIAGSNNPARYRFSMDVNILGNNGGNGTTPLTLGISASDMNYETAYNIDVNGDGDFDDGAEVYNHGNIKPTVAVSGEWVNIGFTFDQGEPQNIDADVLPEHRVFSNGLALQWYLSYGSGEFGLDSDNIVNVDNFRIEFLPAPNGDYNDDGKVDAADYIVWRKNEGTTNLLPNDNGLGGTIGTAHYELWRSNFGNPAASGSGIVLYNYSSAVPEPNTLALALLSAAAGGLISLPTRRRRTQ